MAAACRPSSATSNAVAVRGAGVVTADAREEAGGTKEAAAVVDGAGERTVEHKRLGGTTARRTLVNIVLQLKRHGRLVAGVCGGGMGGERRGRRRHPHLMMTGVEAKFKK